MVRPNLDIQYLVPQIIKQKKDILDEIGCIKADYTFVVIAAYLLSTKPDNEIKAFTNTTPNIFDNKEVVEIEKRYLKSSSEQIEIVQDLKEKLIQEKHDIFLIWQLIAEGWSFYAFNK